MSTINRQAYRRVETKTPDAPIGIDHDAKETVLSIDVLPHILGYTGELAPSRVSRFFKACHQFAIEDIVNKLVANPQNRLIQSMLSRKISVKSLDQLNERLKQELSVRKYTHVQKHFDALDPTRYETMQAFAQQNWKDHATMTLWERLTPFIHFAMNEEVPKTPSEIKNWMADPGNAPRLRTIVHINMSGCKLKVIPSEIQYLTHLRKVILKDNQIEDLRPLA